MTADMLDLLARIRQKTFAIETPQKAFYCGFEDCGVAYSPSGRDNLGGSYWTCPDCGRLTKEAEMHRPNPDDS